MRTEWIYSVLNILFKLCSLRRFKGSGCAEVYTNLFETSSVWQVFNVGVSSVLQTFACEKRLLISKKDYQGQILVMSGWVCSWKNAQGMFLAVPWVWLWPLSDSTMSFYVYIRQKDDKQLCDITWSNQETFNFLVKSKDMSGLVTQYL